MPYRSFFNCCSLIIGILGMNPWINPAIASDVKNVLAINVLAIGPFASPAFDVIHYTSPPPEALLNQGQDWYDQGALQKAWEAWNQALAVATTPDLKIASLNALAIVEQDLGHWDTAAAHLNQAESLLQASPQTSLQAKLLNTRGMLAFRQGHIQEALETWEQGSVLYQNLGDSEGYLLSQINQIYALQALGFYDRARKQLGHLQNTIAQLPVGSSLQVHSLQSLGEILKGFGRYSEAATILEQAFTLAAQAGLQRLMAEILLDQGTLYATQGEHIAAPSGDSKTPINVEKALEYFDRLQALQPPPLLQIEADFHEFQFLLTLNRPVQALDRWKTLEPQLAQLSPSRFSVSAKISAANSLIQARNGTAISSPLRPFRWPMPLDLAQLLRDAIQDARWLGDPRLQSFALGQLGHLYELNRQYPEALDLTEQALVLAQTVRAEDAMALWQWQTGRILKAEGNADAALVAYQEAAKTLTNIRQDLVATPTEVQFSFRDSVEPVYRELTALLLDNLEQYSPTDQQTRLQKAREAIESLQLAELENFFREACLNLQGKNLQGKTIDALDSDAAIVYPILLNDRVEVIVSLPDRSLQHFRYNISQTRRNVVFQELKKSFNLAVSTSLIQRFGAEIYDWILRPVDPILETQGVKTIVFVLDSSLRSIPMGILHDGQHFLIEKYNLALAPGLQLLQSQSAADFHNFSALKVLLGGLSDSRNDFPPLPNVQLEINELSRIVNPNPTILLNEHFTQQNVMENLRDYPAGIVHLATHGQFSSDAEKTFLLAWDGLINVRTLDQVLKERVTATPIELLVLSACETAQGDEQAILGLAGMAVRSGAHSTLGTLWPINDRSTANFMVHFYQNLTSGQEKAQALRNAQLAFLHSEEYGHPYYWAPFVLVGQWQ